MEWIIKWEDLTTPTITMMKNDRKCSKKTSLSEQQNSIDSQRTNVDEETLLQSKPTFTRTAIFKVHNFTLSSLRSNEFLC